MSNINKILIAVVSCVFMICVAAVSIVGIVTSDKNEATTTTTTTTAQAVQGSVSTTEAAPSKAPVQTSAHQTTTAVTQQGSVPSDDKNTVASTTGNISYDNEAHLARELIGKWTDSAGMSGYEFLEGGRVSMTYVDLAQFGVPFNGKASGLYTLAGDVLTVKFSIYSATIKKTYRIIIEGNELSMYDVEEKETSTYARVVTQ